MPIEFIQQSQPTGLGKNVILLILCFILIGCQQTENTKDVEAVLDKILKCYGYENMPIGRVFFKDNHIFLEDDRCMVSFELPIECDTTKRYPGMCGGTGNSFWIDSFDETFNVTINENLTDTSLSNFIVSNLNGDLLWSCPIMIDGAKIGHPGFAYDENHISFSVDGVSKYQMVVNNKCQEDTSLRAFSLHKISKLGDNYLNAFNIDGKAFVVYKNKAEVPVRMENLKDKDFLKYGFYFEYPYLLLLNKEYNQLYVEKYKLDNDIFVFVDFISIDELCVRDKWDECGWIFPCDDGACIRIKQPGKTKFIKLKNW